MTRKKTPKKTKTTLSPDEVRLQQNKQLLLNVLDRIQKAGLGPALVKLLGLSKDSKEDKKPREWIN